MKCNKCATLLELTEGCDVSLLGGYRAHLCVTCVNAWNKHIRSTPKFRQSVTLDAQRAFFDGSCLAGHRIPLADWQNYYRLLDDSKSACWALAAAWMGPEPEEAADALD